MEIPQNTPEVILGLLVALTAYFARKGQKDSREAKDTVKNGITNRLRNIEQKTDRISQRLDDHIEAHKERTHARRDSR